MGTEGGEKLLPRKRHARLSHQTALNLGELLFPQVPLSLWSCALDGPDMADSSLSSSVSVEVAALICQFSQHLCYPKDTTGSCDLDPLPLLPIELLDNFTVYLYVVPSLL